MRISRTTCTEFSFRVPFDAAQYRLLQAELKKIIDPEKDSLRFYMLGNGYQTKNEYFGAKTTYNPEGTLIL